MNNAVANSRDTQASKDFVAIRWPYVIGSGDLNEIRVSLTNWWLNYGTNTLNTTGNTLPVDSMSIEYNGATTPIYFNGSRSVTLIDGDTDIVSDPIYPSAFSTTSFPRGATIYIKMLIKFANTTGTWYTPVTARNAASGGQVRWGDSSVTTMSNIDAAGAWTWTGTTPGSRSNGYAPTIIGRYNGTTPKVWLFVGDSITQGTGDTTGSTRVTGYGWPSRACLDSDDSSNPVSFFNYAVHGSASTLQLADNRILQLYKYATHATLFYGTNDFGNSGTGVTVAAMQSRIQSIVTNLRAAPYIQKIIGIHFLPRTTSTDSWATLANQSPSGAGWQAGGNIDTFNQWITSQVGTLFDGYQHFPSTRDSTNDFAWVTNGTALYSTGDGTHPTSTMYGLMASDIRTQMQTI